MSEYKNYDWDNPENPNALASNDMGLEGLNWDDIDENGYHEPLSDQKSNQRQASISPFSTRTPILRLRLLQPPQR
jgi:hypothetical protein